MSCLGEKSPSKIYKHTDFRPPYPHYLVALHYIIWYNESLEMYMNKITRNYSQDKESEIYSRILRITSAIFLVLIFIAILLVR